MKTIINIHTLKFLFLIVFIGVFTACSDDFLDRPPEDSYSVDEFFQTTEQVVSATNALYTSPWYNFNTNTIWTIGELSSGNGRTWDPRNADFTNFAINGNHSTLTQAWESLYAVVGQANFLINTLPEAVSPDVPQDVVNNALGEARFVRAVAYFYLVRIFGSVPIIENNDDYILEPVVPRNLVSDVFKFIRLDLEYAMDNCYSKIRGGSSDENAKVSIGTATAMLSKVYLYEKNYTEAYNLSDAVIRSGEFKLYGGDAEDGDPSGSYYDLFSPDHDNNPESIFALQWAASAKYGEGNGIQSLFGPSGFTGGSDGWSAIGPSPDLLGAYEDKEKDKRFYATIMAPGAFYPDINGGYLVPDNVDFQGTGHGLKKYVVGSAAATSREDGSGQTQTSNNTYILRYGELLLIHAEAAIMGGGSVEEGTKSYNKIRRRAGLDEKMTITAEDIFQERRIELAFEFEFWYDVVRQGSAFATDFLSTSDRGTFDSSTAPPTLNSEYFTATEDDLIFPYPTSETQNNPALLEPPVPYDFN